MNEITIPRGAKKIIAALNDAGFEAYVVGGCVRDSLLGREPKDWDICTNAKCDEVKSSLELRTVDTGIKHGTVTVLADDGAYEVTTYRRDGDYSDNRHPDSVEFVNELREDLARRDFTVNAMAYNQAKGLVDEFGGLSDIENKLIACVGVADDRFKEDALRIMRALRFASVYGYSIEKETSDAIHRNKSRLASIAQERIQAELVKLLHGEGVFDILSEYGDVISEIIPEIKPCIGFEQNNKYHKYTVYEHIAHAVENYKGGDTSVKIALLLHDIGKPQVYSEDENGGHFYEHAVHSHEMAKNILERLKFDNKTKSEVLELVLYHDLQIEPTPKSVRRRLGKMGERRLRQLLWVKLADILAHSEKTWEAGIGNCNAVELLIDEIISEEQCFTLKDLAVNGTDLMAVGIKEGREVGQILHTLLEMVIDGKLKNVKEDLIAHVLQSLLT